MLIDQRPTPWRHGRGGVTDLVAEDLLATIDDLLVTSLRAFPARRGDISARIEAIAVSGMGETGFLVSREQRCHCSGFRVVRPTRTGRGRRTAAGAA